VALLLDRSVTGPATEPANQWPIDNTSDEVVAYHLVDIRFAVDQAKTLALPPAYLGTEFVVNNSGSEEIHKLTLRNDVAVSTTWNMDLIVVPTSKVTCRTTIPIVGPTTVEAVPELEQTWRWGESITNHLILDSSMEATVPPNSTMQCTGKLIMDDVTMPFTGTLEAAYRSGRRERHPVAGQYKGVQCRAVAVEWGSPRPLPEPESAARRPAGTYVPPREIPLPFTLRKRSA